MKIKRPCSKKIEWICEFCNHKNSQRGSNNSLRFELLLKHAKCEKCKQSRNKYICGPHEQECSSCNIPFNKKELVGGRCMPCYMFAVRNKPKDDQSFH